MTRAYNFSPGPCTLPNEIMVEAQAEFCEYQQAQASIIEISHRSQIFIEIYNATESLLRELLNIPENYAVLFLPGGATLQTAAIPLNILGTKNKAAYLVTGHWSERAKNEAKKYCQIHIAACTKKTQYTTLPKTIDTPNDCAYLYYTANETIHGVEFSTRPESSIPLVTDMSSNILTRAIQINDYGIVYAGAQKNIAPAGITIVIVRRDLICPNALTPSVIDYNKQINKQSMYNTPPTFQIYMIRKSLTWLKQQGGITEMEKRCQIKSDYLYDFLERSDFYHTNVDIAARSRVNVPFFLVNDALTSTFLQQAEKNGFIGLKGHVVLGGCRASIYNAMPMSGVQALVSYMQDFEKKWG